MADLSDRKSDRLVLVKNGRDFYGITLGFWGLIASKIYACVSNRGKPINKKRQKNQRSFSNVGLKLPVDISILWSYNISYPFIRPLVGVESPSFLTIIYKATS